MELATLKRLHYGKLVSEVFMNPLIIPIKNLVDESIKILSNAIKNGDLCVIPTDTVYGLAGDGLNENAIKKIYEAKGRPSDNPLILHVSSMDMAKNITRNIPDNAYKLMDAFWPGALTLVLPKASHVPNLVTGGLDSVAVRMPNLKKITDLIEACNTPLAAPSANLSGKPSSTHFSHVLNDFKSTIPYMIDGGKTLLGLESTVLDCTKEPFTLLRPGSITQFMIEEVLNKPIYTTFKKEAIPKSPGVKYQHYKPHGTVHLIDDLSTINLSNINDSILIHTKEDDISSFLGNTIILGSKKDPSTMDENLYHVLRKCDTPFIKDIYVMLNDQMSDAIKDRLKRASSKGKSHD